MAGATVSRTPHFALHRAAEATGARQSPGAGGSARVAIGALVPKRWARRAVTRNLLKRQIYQLAATFEARLPPCAHVIRLRSGFDRSQFPSAASTALKRAVRAELEQLLERAAFRAQPGLASAPVSAFPPAQPQARPAP